MDYRDRQVDRAEQWILGAAERLRKEAVALDRRAKELRFAADNGEDHRVGNALCASVHSLIWLHANLHFDTAMETVRDFPDDSLFPRRTASPTTE